MGKYQGYEKYKDSGVEWLGEIPEHWNSPRLRFVLETNPSKSEISLNSDELVQFVPMEAVSEYGGINLEFEKILDDVFKGYTYFKNGDVVFAKITPCFENGKSAIAENLKNGVAFGTTELHVLRASNNLDNHFLFYIIISQVFRNLGEAEMYGAGGQKRVPENYIKNFRCAFPPLDEQESIAHFLDRKTSQIDALIAKKAALLEKLDEKRTALISHAVTKGLDPSVPMKASGVEWLGDIPEHWTVLKLGRLCDVTKLTGFEYTKTWRTDPIGEIIALRGFNIKNNQLILNDVERITSELSNELSRSKLYDGDIVFPCTGTLGEGAIIDEDDRYHINQNIAKISPTHDVNRKFLLFYLCSKNMKYQIDLYNTSGVQPVLLIGTIRSLMIAIPNYNEQNLIAEYLKNKTAEIDRQKAKVKEAIELLKEYRTALITNAVTGKIDVRQVANV